MLIRLFIYKSVIQPKDEEKHSIHKILSMNRNCAIKRLSRNSRIIV